MKLNSRKLSILPVLGALVAFSVAPAARAQETVVQVQEDAARALRRAEELLQQGRFQSAAAEYERASELQGGSCAGCLLGVARAYSGARQYEAGIQVTRMALALVDSPEEQARAYDQLGSLLALKGDMNGAREAFGKAVQLDGRMAGQVRASLAEALLKRANYAQADEKAAAAASEPVEVGVRRAP
jgi:tetratricopeptide (TPR) repeat protein